MRVLLSLLAVGVAIPGSFAAAQVTEANRELARRVLSTTPLIDGHNDLPWAIRQDPTMTRDVEAYDLRKKVPGHTDIERLRKGMLGGQFWSVYIPGEIPDSGYARVQLEQIDIARRIIEKYPDVLQYCETALCMRQAFAARRIGSLLGMEGGHAIENSLGALRAFYTLGSRYMTLTHNVTLDWADAAAGPMRHNGLSKFGEEVVREMNRLGMLVDLSHVSAGVMSDAIRVSEAPVMFSHSNARQLADVGRNAPDSILRKLPANGGVIMVTFVDMFTSQEYATWNSQQSAAAADARRRFPNDAGARDRAVAEWQGKNPRPRVTLSQLADHIDHIRKVASVDNVGIGGDFDGISTVIEGLEDVSTYPALFAELARRGWTETDLRKLAGENILRAFEQAERVAARLQLERPASTKTIQQLDGKT